MYSVGEYVVKANKGVCRIEDIMHLDMPGIDKNQLYYYMVPLDNPNSKLYVPIDDKKNEIRKIMTESQAWDVINAIPGIEATWIDNDKQREQKYKEVIQSRDPQALVGIIKCMYFRKRERSAQGKKSTAVDEHYFKLAEDSLYSELAFAIGREKSEMKTLIETKANEA